jgi:L-lactate dehydrogenase complex protein LldG
MTAREDVLGRIRAAIGNAAPETTPSTVGYRTTSGLGVGELIALFAERLRDYGATVRQTAPGELGATVGAALAERGANRIVLPPGIEVPVPAGVQCVTDDGLSAAELGTFDGVITAAAAAIAETGTIVLDGSPGQGRRALSLVPDYHLCVLRTDQVVGLVPEAIASLDPGRALTWISGPSATSDIELDRVQGVHGPRTLEVIVVDAGPAEATGG